MPEELTVADLLDCVKLLIFTLSVDPVDSNFLHLVLLQLEVVLLVIGVHCVGANEVTLWITL